MNTKQLKQTLIPIIEQMQQHKQQNLQQLQLLSKQLEDWQSHFETNANMFHEEPKIRKFSSREIFLYVIFSFVLVLMFFGLFAFFYQAEALSKREPDSNVWHGAIFVQTSHCSFL